MRAIPSGSGRPQGGPPGPGVPPEAPAPHEDQRNLRDRKQDEHEEQREDHPLERVTAATMSTAPFDYLTLHRRRHTLVHGASVLPPAAAPTNA
jgi:hypothetical protein